MAAVSLLRLPQSGDFDLKPRLTSLDTSPEVAWIESPSVQVLDNGMTLAVLSSEAAPVVSTCLWSRIGAAVEPAETPGITHFLEHMMFKGSSNYPAGEIDRLSQAVGGSNNAFTSHDSTVFTFSLPAVDWELAVKLEVDRLRSLLLDPLELESERRVILEEISQAASSPWDRLETSVSSAFFGTHPYGRNILGSRESVGAIGERHLRDWHLAVTNPAELVLVVSGDLPANALDRLARACGDLQARAACPPVAEPKSPTGLERLELSVGRSNRCLLAMPSPAAGSEDFVPLRMALTVLTGGRLGRLQRRLVEEVSVCRWVSSSLLENVRSGACFVALELLPNHSRAEVEEVLFEELRRLARLGPTGEEVDTARSLLRNDWLFELETIEQRGASLGASLALFSRGHTTRQLERLQTATGEEIGRAAERYLGVEDGASGVGGLLGWAGRSS